MFDSRGVYDALARSESASLGLKGNKSGLEASSLKRSLEETRCGLRWTHSAAHLTDCITQESEETQKPFELLKRRGGNRDWYTTRPSTRPASEHRRAMMYWTVSTRRTQRKSSWNTSRDSTTGCESFRVLWCACTVWTFFHLECLTIFSRNSTGKHS